MTFTVIVTPKTGEPWRPTTGWTRLEDASRFARKQAALEPVRLATVLINIWDIAISGDGPPCTGDTAENPPTPNHIESLALLVKSIEHLWKDLDRNDQETILNTLSERIERCPKQEELLIDALTILDEGDSP